MEIKQNFDNLTDDIKEYIALKSDSVKLQIVENLSLVSSDIFSYLIFFSFIFVSFLFLLFALMLFIAQYLGLLYSSLVIGVFLAIIALVIFVNRKYIFGDMFVNRFCKMFFSDNVVNNEK